jgi:hypothetical protein
LEAHPAFAAAGPRGDPRTSCGQKRTSRNVSRQIAKEEGTENRIFLNSLSGLGDRGDLGESISYFPFFSCSRAPANIPGSA